MSLTKALLMGTLVAVCAAPAWALEVKREVQVASSPAAAWKAIGDFCGIGTWHPAVSKCELSRQGGATLRTLSLNGGGTIVEKLIGWDAKHHRYRYAIVDSPLPISDYQSTIAVAKHGRGSTITWSGTFNAKGAPDAKAKEVVAGIYDGGLQSLSKTLSH